MAAVASRRDADALSDVEAHASSTPFSVEDRLHRVEPALVVRGPLVLLGRHALDAAPQLVDVHHAASAEHADDRVHEHLPVGELVLLAVDRLGSRPAAAVVHRPLHTAIVAPMIRMGESGQ